MSKSITINFNSVRKDSAVKVGPGPILFGKDLPSFWIKADEYTKSATGFVFQDSDVAEKFMVDFAAACWRKRPEKTLANLKLLVDQMKKIEKAKCKSKKSSKK